MKYKQQALDILYSKLPELRELSFGCEVEWRHLKDDGETWDWRKGKVTEWGEDIKDTNPGGLGHVQEEIPYWCIYLDEPYTDCDQLIVENYECNLKIIGHPPQLQHWLQVLGKRYSVDGGGQVWPCDRDWETR